MVKDSDACWIQSHEGTATGGDQLFTETREFTMRHQGGPLDLIVAWLRAELGNARVRIPL